MHRKHYKLTPRSGNSKTGPIAVTMSDKRNCPKRCPFINGKGCYAENFPLALHWGRLNEGKAGNGWKRFLQQLSILPPDMPLRLWTAGDFPGDGYRLNRKACVELADLLKDRRAPTWGYTRYNVDIPENKATVRYMLAAGIVVNVSCLASETEYMRRNLYAGIPCTIVIPEGVHSIVYRIARKIRRCPAQQDKSVTCAQCLLCSKANRKVAVAFEAHGSRKRLVSSICR